MIEISLVWFSGTVIRDEVGLSLDKAGKEVLGHASKVVLTKDYTTIVGDGSTQEAVSKRVAQIRNLIEVRILASLSNKYICFFFFRLLVLLFSALEGDADSYYMITFVQAAEQDYEKEKLNERIAKLSGGVAVIQVGSLPWRICLNDL